MPEFLADGFPVNTQDTFVDALSLGPAAGVRSISFSVLGVNAVTVQAWRYTDASKTKWILEPFTRVFAGQSVGVVVRNCAGLRFANATAGKASLVVAELDYESDVDLSGGSITSATIDGSGNITPSPGVAITRTVLAVAGSGTYQTPAGCRAILVECIGGGGGSPGLVINPTNAGVASGGGGGAYAASLIESPAASYAFTVGAANGGDSSFGNTLVVAKGGSIGAAAAATGFLVVQGGAGGQAAASTGDVVMSGSDGGDAVIFSATSLVPAYGGAAARGGGSTAPAGGTANQNGRSGDGPGGGAAGGWVRTSGTVTSGNGAQGMIIVTEFY